MQQTLLVLLGVIVFGLYGYSQHEKSAADERTAIRRELESAALGLATDWAARVRQNAFDEATFCDPTPRIKDASGSLTGLTAPASLGPESGESALLPTSWNDVDDANGFSATLPYPVRSETADFQLTIDIYYTDHNVSELDSLGTTSLAKFARIRSTYVEPTPATPTFKPSVYAEVDVLLAQAALTMARLEREGRPSSCPALSTP